MRHLPRYYVTTTTKIGDSKPRPFDEVALFCIFFPFLGPRTLFGKYVTLIGTLYCPSVKILF